MQKPFRLFSSLPWIIALAALALFVATLNTFVSLASVPAANDVAQWEPVTQTSRPLLWLLTRPVSWIGGSAQFIGMNLLSAVFAALTIAQLVRTVTLFPHDRTRDQRNRETHEKGLLSIPLAWVPPLVAAMVCAFQLKFWEHATALTGEMLDLMVFAFCIRCLMEHRLTGKDRWLNYLALAYGFGVTNNAAMIAFFPLFVGSLIWIRGMKFFQFPFLFRMVGLGVAGLSLYLLLPIVATVKGVDGIGFWEVLKSNLAAQKQMILTPFVTVPVLRLRLILMSMTSLVPLILVGFRWPSMTTETSSLGRNLLSFLFVVAGGAFVAAGIAGSFALPFGPFELGYRLFPFLSIYYLTALSVGYFTGYILLVLLTEPESRWQRSKPVAIAVGKGFGYLALVAVLVAPIFLAVDSFKSVAFTNGPTLNRTMLAKLDSLPDTRVALLSDDGFRLILLEAAMQKNAKPRNDVLLDTEQLKFTNTVGRLTRKYPDLASVWSTVTPSRPTFEPVEIVKTLTALQKSIPTYYLNPSFGYFFEWFYPTPHAGVYELKPYQAGQQLPSKPDQDTLALTAAYWDKMDSDVLGTTIRTDFRSNLDARYLKQMLSLELDDWGVTLQRAGKLKEAQVALEVAVNLRPPNPLDDANPRNPSAETTLAYNKHLQAPQTKPPEMSPSWKAILEDPASIQTAMVAFGPVDEPTSLSKLGTVFAFSGNIGNRRQGLIMLSRAQELDPANSDIQIALASTRLNLQQPTEALKLVRSVREGSARLSSKQHEMLLNVESLALAASGNVAEGEAVLKKALEKDRNNPWLESLLISYYRQTGQLERALQDIDHRIALDPKDESNLINKAALLIETKRYAEALAPVEKVLEKNPQSLPALQSKAYSLFMMNRFADSKVAYENLLKVAGKPVYQAYWGLAGIAVSEKDTKEAIKQLDLYLTHAPNNTAEYELMQSRLEQLKNPARNQ